MTQLLYLLVGAALAMGAQSLVQLVVVPRVDARKRREDRWERDVLALGELLTAELPDRATAAKSDQWHLQFVNTLIAEGEVAKRRDATVRELAEKADESVRRYLGLANTRVTWLAQRIVDIAPDNQQLQELFLVFVQYRVASGECTVYAQPLDGFDNDTFDAKWAEERKYAATLAKAVLALSRQAPPRSPSWLRRTTRWFTKRLKRQERQVKRVESGIAS